LEEAGILILVLHMGKNEQSFRLTDFLRQNSLHRQAGIFFYRKWKLH